MARIKMEEQEEFLTLPGDSIINVKVEKAEVREVPGRKGNWEKLELTFKVLGVQVIGDGSPVEQYASVIGSRIWGGCGFRLTDHPDNKLRQWVEALLGMEIAVGFELDTDYLVGREARAITGLFEKRTNDPRTGRPYQGHQVESLLAKSSGSAVGGWGGQQQQAPQVQQVQQQAPVTNPWASQPPAAQPVQQPVQQQPAFSGWGMNGSDDPPF